MQDAFRKGRMDKRTSARGEINGIAILREGDVVSILEALRNGKHGIGRQLARKYGVAETTICAIKNGVTWKHIERRL